MTLTYGSVCSGMEAASLAWAPLGWKCAFVAEHDPLSKTKGLQPAQALLAQRFSDVPNLGDMTKFKDWPDYAIDLLVGGTPCQSFSVAGLRKGLADPRGNLMLTFGAIAKRLRPAWLLWENVPGVLSSNGGRDFGSFLGMLAELGYGFAYRVLDAQFFGLAQRRARVFVVGYLGDWRPPAAVLFERESLRGDSPPSREAGQRAAPTIAGGARRRGGYSHDDLPLARCVTAREGQRQEHTQETYIVEPQPILEVGKGSSSRGVGPNGVGIGEPGDPMYTLQAGAQHAIAFDTTQITSKTNRSQPRSGEPCHPVTAEGHPPAIAQPYTLAIRGRGDSHDLEYRQDGVANAVLTPNGGRAGIGVGAVAFDARQSDVIQYGDMSGPLDTDQQSIGVLTSYAVRRLTPRECERLQGAPDDWTLITYRGKPIADGPRYKMIGNSFAVNVVRWIGERISVVRALKHATAESTR